MEKVILYDRCENCGNYHPYEKYNFYCPSEAGIVEGIITASLESE